MYFAKLWCTLSTSCANIDKGVRVCVWGEGVTCWADDSNWLMASSIGIICDLKTTSLLTFVILLIHDIMWAFWRYPVAVYDSFHFLFDLWSQLFFGPIKCGLVAFFGQKKAVGLNPASLSNQVQHIAFRQKDPIQAALLHLIFWFPGANLGLFSAQIRRKPDFLLQKCVEDKLTLDLINAWAPFYFPHTVRVAELVSLSSGAKIAMKSFVKCVFTIFRSHRSSITTIP